MTEVIATEAIKRELVTCIGHIDVNRSDETAPQFELGPSRRRPSFSPLNSPGIV